MHVHTESFRMWETLKQRLKRVWKPEIIREWTEVWKQKGFGGLMKAKGWKIVLAVFLFYLIRDSLLYILLPYLAARGLFGC